MAPDSSRPTASSLRGKKILVTGADGFIGSHLVEHLLQAGAEVRAFSLYNSFNSAGWLDRIPKNSALSVVSGDIRDERFVQDAVRGTELIFHLAALIAIPYSYVAPRSYIDVNVGGTLNVLTAARDLGGIRTLVTSTSEVYGTARYVPIDEKHPFQAQSPYSASKIAADRVAESFYCSFGLPVTIVRPFNTYGPRQSARAIIPTIITQLLSGATEIKLGNTDPTRDFTFVHDTCRGFLAIAESSKTIGEEINIGTGTEISMGELAQKLIHRLNPLAKIISEQARIRPERSEVERLLASTEKLSSLTGWQPKISLDQGIDETIDWLRENLQFYKPSQYNL